MDVALHIICKTIRSVYHACYFQAPIRYIKGFLLDTNLLFLGIPELLKRDTL